MLKTSARPPLVAEEMLSDTSWIVVLGSFLAPCEEVGDDVDGVSVAELARARGGTLPRLRCAQPAHRDRDAADASVRRRGRPWRLAGDEYGRGRRAPRAAGQGSAAARS